MSVGEDDEGHAPRFGSFREIDDRLRLDPFTTEPSRTCARKPLQTRDAVRDGRVKLCHDCGQLSSSPGSCLKTRRRIQPDHLRRSMEAVHLKFGIQQHAAMDSQRDEYAVTIS